MTWMWEGKSIGEYVSTRTSIDGWINVQVQSKGKLVKK